MMIEDHAPFAPTTANPWGGRIVPLVRVGRLFNV